MGFKKGEDRYQVRLLPPAIEDYVPQNDEVRVIDAFVDKLTGIKFQYSDFAGRGNQPYDPKDMLKIYIYCYLKGIRSSRKIEKECESNLKLIWLINGLTPDDKTICDFRKNNKEQLYQVLKEFTTICKNAKLFAAELVAIDGSKFEASCAKNKIFTRDKLKHRIESIDYHISNYLNQIEKNDILEMQQERLTKEEIENIISNLQEKRAKYQELSEELEKTDDKQISFTDSDCRLMKKRNGKCNPCYNVQVASDSKYNMIVDFEVTNHTNDTQELSNMAIKAKEELGVDELKVVADSGYENRVEFDTCIENNIIPIVDIKSTEQGNGYFPKDKFVYDTERDLYICPAKREMYCVGHEIHKKGKKKLRHKIYKEKYRCKDCELRKECFNNQNGSRRILRWEKEGIVDKMKTKESREELRKRKGIIEPVFGVVKRCFGFEYVLTRGFGGVKAEFSLAFLAYNLKRAINILGVNQLINLITG